MRRLSIMETNGSPIGPDEAATALRDADAAAALAHAVPPWWYFGSLAALIAVTPVVELAPATALGITATLVGIVCWAALFGLVLGTFVRRIGFVPRLRRAQRRHVLPPLLVVVAILVTGAILHLAYDTLWPSFAASGLVAALVLVFGGVVRRTARTRA